MEISEEHGQSQAHPATTILPEDLIVWEILVRLPAKDLLRCRTVCRAWHHRTSAVDFLLAHHRHQPSLLLIHKHGRAIDVDDAFDALDLRRRPTECQPVLRINYIEGSYRFLQVVRASCDGLILLSVLDTHRSDRPWCCYLCNPSTRQSISVPMSHHATVLGMYSHSLTGEYRVLYWERTQFTARVVYYVLTLGSAEPRCIEQPLGSPSVRTFVEFGLEVPSAIPVPTIFLHDCLHWMYPDFFEQNVVVFDTIWESFRLMRLPTEACQLELKFDDSSCNLLEIDGALGISWGGREQMMMKLWVLDDYETEAWSLKYQIEFSMADLCCVVGCSRFDGTIVSMDGDTLVRCFHSSQLFHIDSKGRLLQTLQYDGLFPGLIGYRFRESLVKHAFLEGPREGDPSEEPQFFVGL